VYIYAEGRAGIVVCEIPSDICKDTAKQSTTTAYAGALMIYRQNSVRLESIISETHV
jgi:hypothetical protein